MGKGSPIARFRQWIRLLLAAAPLAMACAQPIQQQRSLAALHSQALGTCKQAPARCASLLPCSKAILGSMQDWQRVTEAAAAGDAEGEIVERSGAALSEHRARILCAEAGVK